MSLVKKLFKTPKTVDNDSPFETGLPWINKAHHHVQYRGVSMIKCPFDIVNYQMIISQLRPDLILEIGTNKGGSALYFSDLLKNLGKGDVHTIDLKQKVTDSNVLEAENITFFEGGWQNYSLSNCGRYERILIIDDGSHAYDEVKAAFEKFHGLVAVGSYYIIEDGIIDELDMPKAKFNGGPKKAAEEILHAHPSFVLDEHWINFYGPNATFNPLGYLKRV